MGRQFSRLEYGDQRILIVYGNRHRTDLLVRLLERVGKLFEGDTAILPDRVARERAPRLGLAKAAWIHNGCLANRPDEGRMRVANYQHIGIDRLDFLYPTIRVLRAVSEQRICRT